MKKQKLVQNLRFLFLSSSLYHKKAKIIYIYNFQASPLPLTMHPFVNVFVLKVAISSIDFFLAVLN